MAIERDGIRVTGPNLHLRAAQNRLPRCALYKHTGGEDMGVEVSAGQSPMEYGDPWARIIAEFQAGDVAAGT